MTTMNFWHVLDRVILLEQTVKALQQDLKILKYTQQEQREDHNNLQLEFHREISPIIEKARNAMSAAQWDEYLSDVISLADQMENRYEDLE